MAHHHDPFSPEAAVKPVSGKKAAPTEEAPKQAQEQQEPEAQQATPPTKNKNDVPEGTVDEVLAWVGESKRRARAALKAEKDTGDPRVTLVSALEEKIE